MHVYIPIVPCIFVPCADNTTLTLQWKGNNGVGQLGLKRHDNKCDKPQSDAEPKRKKTKQKNFSSLLKRGRAESNKSQTWVQ